MREITGEDDVVKLADTERNEQSSSAFHKITMTQSADVSGHTDSPRATASKIKKPSDKTSSTSDRSAPARRGRRPKNCGRKKTPNTATSEFQRTGDKDEQVVADDEVRKEGGKSEADCKSDAPENGEVCGNHEEKESDPLVKNFDSLVDSHHAGSTSDVEQKEPVSAAKGRRCTSVPVRNSR